MNEVSTQATFQRRDTLGTNSPCLQRPHQAVHKGLLCEHVGLNSKVLFRLQKSRTISVQDIPLRGLDKVWDEISVESILHLYTKWKLKSFYSYLLIFAQSNEGFYN